jgi:hypothetical protein
MKTLILSLALMAFACDMTTLPKPTAIDGTPVGPEACGPKDQNCLDNLHSIQNLTTWMVNKADPSHAPMREEHIYPFYPKDRMLTTMPNIFYIINVALEDDSTVVVRVSCIGMPPQQCHLIPKS